MARFDIPDVVDPLHLQLTDFLGVDYNDNVENNRRSPKMINFINKNGYLESRNGHKILLHLDNAPVNGVWNVVSFPVTIFNLIVSNILWVVLSLAIAIVIILVIWFIFKSPPHWIIFILITIFCVGSCLTICYITQQKKIDSEMHHAFVLKKED